MKDTDGITSKLKKSHELIVNTINQFPEMIYVGKCSNNSWALVLYPKYGMGLACFLSKVDIDSWTSISDNQGIQFVEMSLESAIKLAKKENAKYLHLLSQDIKSPLGHMKI